MKALNQSGDSRYPGWSLPLAGHNGDGIYLEFKDAAKISLQKTHQTYEDKREHSDIFLLPDISDLNGYTNPKLKFEAQNIW